MSELDEQVIYLWKQTAERITEQRDGFALKLSQAEARIKELEGQLEKAQTDRDKAWQLAHDPAPCGHPRACWQDKNYPESERNYNAAMKTSDPPSDYHCLMCDLVDELKRLRDAATIVRALPLPGEEPQ